MAKENLTGAASALKWMSEKEAEARVKVESAEAALELALRNQRDKPPATDGEDYAATVRVMQLQRDEAVDAWKKWADTLHKFDKAVPDAKRDTTERISKDEGIQLMQRIGIYLRGGCEALITKLCSDILACRNPQEVHVLIAGALRETILGSIDNALKEGHLPGWVKESLADVL